MSWCADWRVVRGRVYGNGGVRIGRAAMARIDLQTGDDMKRIVFVVAVLALNGCTPAVWTKPGGDSAQFERDKAECLYEGNKATASDPNMFAGLMANDLASQCLQLRGYSKERR